VLWRLSGGGRRAGFTVSRRVGGAVERNRVRRRIREAYRVQQQALRPGIDVVFIGRPVVLTESFAHLYEEMRQALMALTRSAGEQRSGCGNEI
jgi:ribonuclease P protein component